MTTPNKLVCNNSAPNVNDRSVEMAFNHLLKHKEKFSAKHPAAILDLGTGEGYNVYALSKKLREAKIPFSFVCVDIEPQLFMLEQSNEIKFVMFDLEKEQNFGLFDVVMATEVIEHVENPYHFLRVCLTHCKKDGCVVVSTPNVANLYSAAKIAVKGIPSMFTYAHLSLGHQAHIMPTSPFLMELGLRKIGKERNEEYVMHTTYNRNVLLLPFKIRNTRTIKVPGANRLLGEVGIYTVTRQSGK